VTPSPVAARPAGPGVTFSISEEENLITWASEGGDSYAMAFHSPSGCAQVWADLQVVLSSDFDDPTNIYGEPLALPAPSEETLAQLPHVLAAWPPLQRERLQHELLAPPPGAAAADGDWVAHLCRLFERVETNARQERQRSGAPAEERADAAEGGYPADAAQLSPLAQLACTFRMLIAMVS